MMGKIVHNNKSIYERSLTRIVMPLLHLVMLSFAVMWCKQSIVHLQLYGYWCLMTRNHFFCCLCSEKLCRNQCTHWQFLVKIFYIVGSFLLDVVQIAVSGCSCSYCFCCCCCCSCCSFFPVFLVIFKLIMLLCARKNVALIITYLYYFSRFKRQESIKFFQATWLCTINSTLRMGSKSTKCDKLVKQYL